MSDLEQLEQEYVQAGGDLTLLEARLRMTPEERIRAHERALALALAERLREAMEEHLARAREAR